MVQLLKKILLDFSSSLIDDKKIVTIGKEDSETKQRTIYYLSQVRGQMRHTRKRRITKSEFEQLNSTAQKIKVLKIY